MQRSLQGQLLLANPKLADTNFYQTVVLILAHDTDGALGLVLNRPLATTVAEVWQHVSASPYPHNLPLYNGGPCQGPLMVLHQHGELAQGQVLSRLFYSTQSDSLFDLLDKQIAPIMVFAGNCGWSPGQIEDELEANAWLTAPATPEFIFSPQPNQWLTLNRLVTRRLFVPTLNPKAIPEDPSLN